MTIETVSAVQPKDIAAVEFECKNCGAKTVRKLDGKLRVPLACGNCTTTPWFIQDSQKLQI